MARGATCQFMWLSGCGYGGRCKLQAAGAGWLCVRIQACGYEYEYDFAICIMHMQDAIVFLYSNPGIIIASCLLAFKKEKETACTWARALGGACSQLTCHRPQAQVAKRKLKRHTPFFSSKFLLHPSILCELFPHFVHLQYGSVFQRKSASADLRWNLGLVSS
jgi:hypothetical protein